MSWRSKLASKIAGKHSFGDKDKSFSYEAMMKAGFQVITTERIYDRQKEERIFNELFDMKPEKFNVQSPEDRFEFYCAQLELIWGNYTAYHKAWFRAGSSPEFAQLLTAVENMKSYTDMAIERTRHNLYVLNKAIEKIEKPTEAKQTEQQTAATAQKALDTNRACKLKNKKAQLVRNFYITWLVLLMFEYIRKTSNLSWQNEDVNPPLTLAIQTVQPIQQAYAPTTNERPKDYQPPKGPIQSWGKPKNVITEEEGDKNGS